MTARGAWKVHRGKRGEVFTRRGDVRGGKVHGGKRGEVSTRLGDVRGRGRFTAASAADGGLGVAGCLTHRHPAQRMAA
jgi:hypothetical protein